MAVSQKEVHRQFVSRVDDGRKLLSVSALAAGGAILAVSVVGFAYVLAFKAHSPLPLDIFAAVIGGLASAIYLFKSVQVFEQKGERKNRR